MIAGIQVSRYFGLIGVLLGCSVWFVDAFIDSVLFHGESYLESLLEPEPVEIYMRTAGTIIIIAFGLFGQWMFNRNRQLTRRLRVSEQRFRSLVENSSDWVWEIDCDGRFTYVDPTVERLLGYRAEALIGRPMFEFMADEDAEHCRLMFADEGGVASDARRLQVRRFLHQDGHTLMLECSLDQILDADGNVTGYRGVDRDVSEKEMQAALLRKLSAAIEQSSEAVIITDADSVIEYVNSAFTRMTGYRAEEAIGNSPSMLKSDTRDPDFYKRLWRQISKGGSWSGSLVDMRKDGSFFPVLMSVSPIRNDAGEITHYVSLQQDMTEYKRLEHQFQQAQKMEALGTLVGGIAHDFNNMLAALQGNVTIARMRMNGGDFHAAAEKLNQIERIGGSAADLVRQLLSFSRKDRLAMGELPLRSFLNETAKLAAVAIPENINFIRDICSEGLTIRGDSPQIQQLVMNLLYNARDAVAGESQPQIELKLERFIPDADFLGRHNSKSGSAMALLSVRDNGHGIAEDHHEKVFEPFFTTKKVGEGSGLGLSMVFGVVNRHNGIIELESKPDVGTCFKIYLPLIGSDAGPASHQGYVLVVEDEEQLRSSVATQMRKMGLKVMDAADGLSALELFDRHADDISIVVSDLHMPGMDGIALARAIRDRNAKLPLIFITGYDQKQGELMQSGVDHMLLLRKPFHADELVRMVETLIG